MAQGEDVTKLFNWLQFTCLPVCTFHLFCIRFSQATSSTLYSSVASRQAGSFMTAIRLPVCTLDYFVCF